MKYIHGRRNKERDPEKGKEGKGKEEGREGKESKECVLSFVF